MRVCERVSVRSGFGSVERHLFTPPAPEHMLTMSTARLSHAHTHTQPDLVDVVEGAAPMLQVVLPFALIPVLVRCTACVCVCACVCVRVCVCVRM